MTGLGVAGLASGGVLHLALRVMDLAAAQGDGLDARHKPVVRSTLISLLVENALGGVLVVSPRAQSGPPLERDCSRAPVPRWAGPEGVRRVDAYHR